MISFAWSPNPRWRASLLLALLVLSVLAPGNVNAQDNVADGMDALENAVKQFASGAVGKMTNQSGAMTDDLLAMSDGGFRAGLAQQAGFGLADIEGYPIAQLQLLTATLSLASGIIGIVGTIPAPGSLDGPPDLTDIVDGINPVFEDRTAGGGDGKKKKSKKQKKKDKKQKKEYKQQQAELAAAPAPDMEDEEEDPLTGIMDEAEELTSLVLPYVFNGRALLPIDAASEVIQVAMTVIKLMRPPPFASV
eukprot:gene2386-8694_t